MLLFILGTFVALCLPSFWKLFRVSWLLPSVDIGEDMFDPAAGNEQIPSIIHHLSASDEVPVEWKQSYESTKGVHLRYGAGAYEHKLWTDKDILMFIAESYPAFLSTFESYQYNIERVDAARYFILLHFGGVYLDLDVGARRSLDNLRRFDGLNTPRRTNLILPLTKPLGVSNDFIMASKQHPFMRFVTQRLTAKSHYRPASLLTPWRLPFFSVLWSTGPLFLSEALYDYLASSEGYANRHECAFLSTKDYTRKLFYHLPGSSWLGWDGKMLLFLWYEMLPFGWRLLEYAFFAAFVLLGLVLLGRRMQASSRQQRESDDASSLSTFKQHV